MGCLSSTLAYGESGSGKTGLVGSFAKAIKAVTGKRTRLYTAEPGGLGTIQHIIDAGLIDVWDISTRPYPSETVDFAANGYWTDRGDITGRKVVAPTLAVFEEFGGFVYEGGTAFGEIILEELRQEGAANKIVGAEKAPQQYTSGALRIAGANQTFYGITQARLRKAITDSQRLPVHVMWTMREQKVRDDDDPLKKQFVYGPLLVGSAQTINVPAWFGNCIHVQATKEMDPRTKREVAKRRVHFKRHYDKDSDTPYLAQIRIPPECDTQMDDSWEVTPDLLTMTRLFAKIEELKQKAKELTI